MKRTKKKNLPNDTIARDTTEHPHWLEGARFFISAAGNYRRHCRKIASKICHECHINFMRFVMQ